jgi:hypothetical protein
MSNPRTTFQASTMLALEGTERFWCRSLQGPPRATRATRQRWRALRCRLYVRALGNRCFSQKPLVLAGLRRFLLSGFYSYAYWMRFFNRDELKRCSGLTSGQKPCRRDRFEIAAIA